MRARIPTLIVGVVGISASAIVGLASPAQAAFYECYSGYVESHGGTYAYCMGGSGELRSLATCIKPTVPNQKVTARGVWVKAINNGGTISYANCPSSQPLAIAQGWEKR
ncbi:hypothetical protein AB0J80_18530 [Actinoplanes sp. NPDC049548]|uniref:hypothetical protein n=1 Tax=Actinoplanes sp. NPDC049548 TaxID=3155152 RepID=UPI0034360741